LQELCIGLEEAFDIEISDNELEYELDIQFHNTWLSSSGVEPKVRQFGVNSTVRKLVRLVDEKLR
jgi:hypothetical protein